MEGGPIAQHRPDVQDLVIGWVGFDIEKRDQGHGGVVPGLGYGKVTENEGVAVSGGTLDPVKK
jgi:hypothetical protein